MSIVFIMGKRRNWLVALSSLFMLMLCPPVLGGTSFVYVNGQPVVMINDSDDPHFYVTDAFSNVRGIYNEKGDSVEVTDYFPFGRPIHFVESEANPLAYKSGILDEEYGTYLLEGSVMNYEIARLLRASDGGNIFLPQSFNPYSYMMNNPFRALAAEDLKPDISLPEAFLTMAPSVVVAKSQMTPEPASLSLATASDVDLNIFIKPITHIIYIPEVLPMEDYDPMKRMPSPALTLRENPFNKIRMTYEKSEISIKADRTVNPNPQPTTPVIHGATTVFGALMDLRAQGVPGFERITQAQIDATQFGGSMTVTDLTDPSNRGSLAGKGIEYTGANKKWSSGVVIPNSDYEFLIEIPGLPAFTIKGPPERQMGFPVNHPELKGKGTIKNSPNVK